MLQTKIPTDEITHINQMTNEFFLRKQKKFNPTVSEGQLLTDCPVKAQAYAGYDPHAVKFDSGEDFSRWINLHTGAKTRAIGDCIFWDEISEEAKRKMGKFHFFHTVEDLSCPDQQERVFRKAS